MSFIDERRYDVVYQVIDIDSMWGETGEIPVRARRREAHSIAVREDVHQAEWNLVVLRHHFRVQVVQA